MSPSSAGPLAAVPSVATTVVTERPYGFYVRMAYVCAAVAFLGFAPTYWAPIAVGTFSAAPIVHLHGLFFFAWTVLFIVQAHTMNGRLRARHRALGLFGIALATAMVLVGVMVAIHSIEVGIAAGADRRARAFSIVPMTTVLLFGGFVAAAIAASRRPAVHMRLMLVATASLLVPAFARIVRVVLTPPGVIAGAANPAPVSRSLVASAAADVVLAVAIAHDWRERGRPHRVYVIAGLVLVAVQVLRVPLAQTAAWHSVTTVLLSLWD